MCYQRLIPSMKFIAASAALACASVMLSPATTWAQTEEPTAGKQVEQRLDLGDGQFIEYLLYLPDKYDGSKPIPFMLFLHGRGESNGPLSLVKKWGPPRLVDEGRKLPYIIASPQCPEEPHAWSDMRQQVKLVLLIRHLEQTLKIDKTRMYLTGLSMGGYGSWTMATHWPEKFAAVAPICGKGDPDEAAKLKDVPIWAWHGNKDTAVPLKHSKDMVAAIRKARGRRARLTVLEEIGHNSWSAAYSTPELYSWFNRHQKKPAEKSAAEK